MNKARASLCIFIFLLLLSLIPLIMMPVTGPLKWIILGFVLAVALTLVILYRVLCKKNDME